MGTMANSTNNGTTSTREKKRRSYVKQTDIPRVALDEALRVPQAIADAYAKKPTKPLDVAIALDMSPSSGPFRDLCGAAIGYGLAEGGPNASQISLTPLGERVAAPLEEGDDARALREAALTPTIMGEFLRRYDGNPLPSDDIARNVLESMGVDRSATDRVLRIILSGAEHVGFMKPVKNKVYIDLDAATVTRSEEEEPDKTPPDDEDKGGGFEAGSQKSETEVAAPLKIDSLRNRRVYISHGKNRKLVQHIKELISYGELEPVVSVEAETTSKPIPQKVMEEMRSCSAGIIHVTGEESLIDSQGNERIIVNQNVLIEIGAAMALYGDRFILLVEEGTSLPSNLQGLYEVRYSGDELGHEATMKLLKVMTQFKSPRAPEK